MREDDFTRTEADAATHAAHLGHHEHIGNPVGNQDPNPLYVRSLGPDPWHPFTCPRCGDEDHHGMPSRCTSCGYENYGGNE